MAPIARTTRHLALAAAAVAVTALAILAPAGADVSADSGRPPLAPATSPALGAAAGPLLAVSPTPQPLYLAPDLIVNRIDPDWKLGRDRIEVRNQGKLNAGKFRVAVLAGAHSYSFSLPGMAAGAGHIHTLPALPCKQPIAVLVDVDHEVTELLENNNGTGFQGSCPID